MQMAAAFYFAKSHKYATDFKRKLSMRQRIYLGLNARFQPFCDIKVVKCFYDEQLV